jgi:hypothetical protein
MVAVTSLSVSELRATTHAAMARFVVIGGGIAGTCSGCVGPSLPRARMGG